MRSPFQTEQLLKSLSNYPVSKGDLPGHEFHGNQYTTFVSAHGHDAGSYTKKEDGTYDFRDTSDDGHGAPAQGGVILDGRSLELRDLDGAVGYPYEEQQVSGNVTVSLEPGSRSFQYLAGRMIGGYKNPDVFLPSEGYKFSYPEGTGNDITPDTVVMFTNNDTPEPRPFATVSQLANFAASDPEFWLDAVSRERNTY